MKRWRRKAEGSRTDRQDTRLHTTSFSPQTLYLEKQGTLLTLLFISAVHLCPSGPGGATGFSRATTKRLTIWHSSSHEPCPRPKLFVYLGW